MVAAVVIPYFWLIGSSFSKALIAFLTVGSSLITNHKKSSWIKLHCILVVANENQDKLMVECIFWIEYEGKHALISNTWEESFT